MITFALLLVQIFWLFAGFKWLGEYSEISLLLMLALSAVVLVYIINKDETPEFKLTWVIPICTAPVFGVLLYLFVVGNWGNIGLKKGLDRRLKETEAFMHTDEETTHSRSYSVHFSFSTFFTISRHIPCPKMCTFHFSCFSVFSP